MSPIGKSKKLMSIAAALAVLLALVRLVFWGEVRAWLYRDYTEVRVVNGSSFFDYPVYSIADGTVSFAEDASMGWGRVVRIVCPVKGRESVESLYAHLARMDVHKGDKVRRGQVIGTIGDADGAYSAHLHFEIRTKPGLPLGGGYGENPRGEFCDPTRFIDRHRKR